MAVTRSELQRRWDFDRNDDLEGWSISDAISNAVLGGAVWLRAKPTPGSSVSKQMYFEYIAEMVSPGGLNIQPDRFNKVRMRVLNLSPETDGFVSWRYLDQPDKEAGTARFTMKPYCREWQDVVCHIDGAWTKPVDRIFIRPILLARAGDIWIDSVEIAKGEPKPKPTRPDVCSDRVVPEVVLPKITAADLREAFKVLDECLIINVPLFGFTQPVMRPGGAYGENWWQLDSSLNMAGTKWVNQELVENMCRGFMAVQAQNPDGRIDLWGSGSARGTAADLSSLPRYLEVAYDVARRSGDKRFREDVYRSLKSYLDWWLSPVKRDRPTGLITAVSEETFASDNNVEPLAVAAVDLNVAVAVGCHNVLDLARRLGHTEDARKYEAIDAELRAAINSRLWDDAKGSYYNYNVKTNKHIPTLISSTFEPLVLGIAPENRIDRLVSKLTDPALFNWKGVCLTSIARTDPKFVEATGPYDGYAWYGDVWTMRNMPVIFGLEDIGRHDLAAELAWMTAKEFNRNWTEYLTPSTGSGEGVQRYGWSASQYIQVIIEHLFGIDYDRMKSRLRVFPHVPAELVNETIAIKRLIIPTEGGARFDLSISPEKNGARKISIRISGKPGSMNVEVIQPLSEDGRGPKVTDLSTGKQMRVTRSFDCLTNVAGVQLGAVRKADLLFEW